MAAPESHSLDTIVDVVVRVSPLAAPRATFNEALIIGFSAHISPADRLKKYGSTAEMLDDGFINTDHEYLAAQKYFAQDPAPMYVWIGRQDVGGAETILDAIEACREKEAAWYVVVAPDAVKADHEAIALWVETATPSTVYAYTTADADVLNGTAGNIGETLMDLTYKRTFGQYSTDSIYAVCGIVGYAMGANTGLANSAYTLKFKQEVGINTEDLTTNAIGLIEGNNVNVYLLYGGFYKIFEQGVMANGQFFDEIINLDMLRNNIQLNVMDLLYGNPKIPQTDEGVNQIIHACNLACQQAVDLGFLGKGQWTGPRVLNLNTGDYLPKGYIVQAQPLSQQAPADRQARKSPSIYIAIKEAGAIHSVLIGVYVDR